MVSLNCPFFEGRKPDRYDLMILIGISCYVLFFIFLSLFKYSIFQYTVDLGIFNQALWTTSHYGGILENTLDAPQLRSHLGNHFSPILLLLTPFYYLYSGPETLLIAQSLLLGLGAVPVYLCGREMLGKKAGLLTGLLYLLYPSLHGVNLSNFHEIAFLPLFLGMGLWGYMTGRKTLCLVFCLLCLFIKEDVALIISMIGLTGLIKTRTRALNEKMEYIILLVLPILILILYFLFIKPSFCWGDPNAATQFLAQYTHPVENLSSHNEERLTYLLQTFLPVLFLPLAAPEILIFALPSFAEILLGQDSFYNIIHQYSALFIPVLFMAVIQALRRVKLSGYEMIRKNFGPMILLLFISSLTCGILWSPVVGVASIMVEGYPSELNDDREQLMMIEAAVPHEASVSTHDQLLPLMSNRMEIWEDYREGVDVILIYPFYSGSLYFSDNKEDIVRNYRQINQGDNLYLFVRKDLTGLSDEIQNNLADLINKKKY